MIVFTDFLENFSVLQQSRLFLLKCHERDQADVQILDLNLPALTVKKMDPVRNWQVDREDSQFSVILDVLLVVYLLTDVASLPNFEYYRRITDFELI
jgi:hypothetical protein